MNDQQHPQYFPDRQLVNDLLVGTPTDRNLADLARLLIRYQDFPGARDIQADLHQLLTKWGHTEESLFAYTRALHQRERVYNTQQDRKDDWA
ncbi:MAG: DUF3288 domain-containing protein [Cyanobacteria bacterium M5B4]|nr:DUF3288 family protein [Cyanobacteria bacterium KgW148]PLS69360.1 MAG: DUF3288 domain-containing protein [Cyanobacteria bacterium M5B4]